MSVSSLCALACLLASSALAENPFLGGWELQLPGGVPGWLGVKEAGGQLQASMLWGWGSVEPTASAKVEGDRLVITRKRTVEREEAGKKVKVPLTETISAAITDRDKLTLTSVKPRDDGKTEEKSEFTGKRTPPMPPSPNLGKVKYGPPISLFNGKDLTGWRLTDPNAVNGWSVKDGLLVNNPVQDEGKPHKNYGNLRTDKEFNDFNLKLEVRLSPGNNSGVYLRGIYECQVADTYGKPLDSHNMGAIYSRIKPTTSAEKPPGQWQTMDITLVKRHVTVILNGTTIIDNQPVEGCTGGALWADVTKPGPIYFQGDHTGIEYRNVVLKPVSE